MKEVKEGRKEESGVGSRSFFFFVSSFRSARLCVCVLIRGYVLLLLLLVLPQSCGVFVCGRNTCEFACLCVCVCVCVRAHRYYYYYYYYYEYDYYGLRTCGLIQ